MGMALKVDVISACRSEGSDRPVDLVYLSSITMGDRHLEAELLNMFAAQLPQYLDNIKETSDDSEIFILAHTLKGAARSIGAFKLADLAGKLEDHDMDVLPELCIEGDLVQTYIMGLSS